jgi:7,8-dihydropterin-6-yl-methyl-4-(beta-D-ribofuranosyl)aminobenzene 5'-phosphate synthase
MTMNKPKITLLVDNHSQQGLESEHGFAALIEVDQQRILFDTGQHEVLFSNAKALGISLDDLDAIILSHGHYDHTGEVAKLLELNPNCKLYLHPKALQSRFSIREGKVKDIAISSGNHQAILRHPDHLLHWISTPTKITAHLGISGTIPKQTKFEQNSGPFFLDREGQQPDPILDDQALWIETNNGLIILTGCCHSGLINTITHIQKVTNTTKISSIIGGLHLRSATREKQEKTVDALQKFTIDSLVTCHCTGDETTQFLQKKLPQTTTAGYAGLTITF